MIVRFSEASAFDFTILSVMAVSVITMALNQVTSSSSRSCSDHRSFFPAKQRSADASDRSTDNRSSGLAVVVWIGPSMSQPVNCC